MKPPTSSQISSKTRLREEGFMYIGIGVGTLLVILIILILLF